MARYRFRLADELGQIVGVHYIPLDGHAEAQEYADALLAHGKCARVDFRSFYNDEDVVTAW